MAYLHNPYGLFGALNLLSQRFKWGFGRCEFVCQCISQADNLDCGSGMALALKLLQPFKGEYILASVQLVIGHSRFNTHIWRYRIQRENPLMSEEELREKMIWIEEDCHYHTCIGLISRDTGSRTGEWSLKVWDYGLWILPSDELHSLAPRLAIRVQQDVLETSFPKSFKWGHLEMTEGVWIDLLPTLANSSFDGNRSFPSSCPRVFISGCHMSGSPCPGVGIARSLHIEFPDADLIAVDTAEDLANGASDPIFNSRFSFPGVLSSSFSGTYSDWQIALWDLVYDLLSRDPSALFLPARDSDVEILAQALHLYESEGKLPFIKASDFSEILSGPDLVDRVLCPSIGTLHKLAKPMISGVKLLDNEFLVPEYLDLVQENISMYQVQDFCNHHGYPLLVKGRRQGAVICHSWLQIVSALHQTWAKDGYIQKFVAGFSFGLCFASYKGELLGAVLMQKNVLTTDGKAWGGELQAVPDPLIQLLRRFCHSLEFTGGSELEYIEDLDGQKWAIDWNPRFPAYIYACHLAGVNLPARLLHRAIDNFSLKDSCNFEDQPSSFTILTPLRSINFTRTVIETVDAFGAATRTGGGGTMIFSGYYGKTRQERRQEILKERIPNLPCNMLSLEIKSLVRTLSTDLSFLLNHSPNTAEKTQVTPYYILSIEAATFSLKSQKAVFDQLLLKWKLSNPLANVFISLFISIKTQPHQALLRAAHSSGYFAECISLAEVRAAIAAGFESDEILLTGPGKFWFGPDTFAMPEILSLRGIFADSLEDLQRIISFISEPSGWLQCKFIGIRLALGGLSRFGININDPQAILETALAIQRLTSHCKVGFHFHHASSNIGPESWWFALETFLSLTSSICLISGKCVSVIDFGGGWQPHFLTFEETESAMIKILNLTMQYHPSIETIQFEPGKSISERSGALICRVLEIRDISYDPAHFPNNQHPIDEIPPSMISRSSNRRACIVDACIAELSVSLLHIHPMLWRSKDNSNDWTILDHDGVTRESDAIWGRSCMEFDRISSNVILPPLLTVGDYVMIAFCGAYDTVMQYNFADGIGRDIHIIP